ncbi:hypothetical protein GLOIN_2v1808942 [Rhizophagus clarus]|uniref:Uncharacterized protein n=1 Tax=Rhizophagus clarus TaxID=94130 RepID=A0A8H3LW30_9GLOM|nr:hypothetical protein GLOIN_2v1808942 [Rhizophagus clarus]
MSQSRDLSEEFSLYTKYTERYIIDMRLNCYILGSSVNGTVNIDIEEPTEVDNVNISIKNLTFEHIKKLIMTRLSFLDGTLLLYNSSDLGSDSDSTNEGVNLNNRDISLRFDIINILIKEFINKKVILIRASPFAGKTSLTQFLEHTLMRLN